MDEGYRLLKEYKKEPIQEKGTESGPSRNSE